MKDYTLFRRDRAGRHGGGVALSVKQHLECIELCVRVDDEQVWSLWIRIKGQMKKADTVGVCSRLPDWDEEAAEPFHRQLQQPQSHMGGALTTLTSAGKLHSKAQTGQEVPGKHK